jgi:ABC-type uncharacterized transport system auxiliary subunit
VRRAVAAIVCAAAMLAGCVSVSLGNADAPGLTYFALADARPPAAAAAPPTGAPRLAIQAAGSDPLADSVSMVFSRRPGERALYQFAAWSERPSRSIAMLAQDRLLAGGRFESVTQIGQPVATDWLLTLRLEQMLHDVGPTPGLARLAVRAELVDRRERAVIGLRLFAASAPVAEPAAAAAAAAFGVATAEVLDQLAPWVESTVAARLAR